MASTSLNIPVFDKPSADFSKPATATESLAASFVLGWEGSSFGRAMDYAKREYELKDDDSVVMEPQALNDKYKDMPVPFSEPTSAKKAHLLHQKAMRDKQLQKTANGHRPSTALEIGKFGAGLAANVIDPIGIVAGIGVGAGLTKLLAKTAFGSRVGYKTLSELSKSKGNLAKAIHTGADPADMAMLVDKVVKLEKASASSSAIARNMVEGAVGNLAEEAAISLPMAREAQEDYDAYESIAFAIGAGMALPAVTGSMSKLFGMYKNKPELAEKSMALAEQQAEAGKRIDTSEVDKQVRVENLEAMETQLEVLKANEAEPDKIMELEKDIQETKAQKPSDPKEVVENANSHKQDMFYKESYERLNNMEDTGLKPEQDDFTEGLQMYEENVKQQYGLEPDTVLEAPKRTTAQLARLEQAIDDFNACLGRTS